MKHATHKLIIVFFMIAAAVLAHAAEGEKYGNLPLACARDKFTSEKFGNLRPMAVGETEALRVLLRPRERIVFGNNKYAILILPPLPGADNPTLAIRPWRKERYLIPMLIGKKQFISSEDNITFQYNGTNDKGQYRVTLFYPKGTRISKGEDARVSAPQEKGETVTNLVCDLLTGQELVIGTRFNLLINTFNCQAGKFKARLTDWEAKKTSQLYLVLNNPIILGKIGGHEIKITLISDKYRHAIIAIEAPRHIFIRKVDYTNNTYRINCCEGDSLIFSGNVVIINIANVIDKPSKHIVNLQVKILGGRPFPARLIHKRAIDCGEGGCIYTELIKIDRKRGDILLKITAPKKMSMERKARSDVTPQTRSAPPGQSRPTPEMSILRPRPHIDRENVQANAAREKGLTMAYILLKALDEESILAGNRIDLRKFVYALAGSENPILLGQKLEELKEQMFLEIGCGRHCVIGSFLIDKLGFDSTNIYAIDPVMGEGLEGFDNNRGRFVRGTIENIPASWAGLKFGVIYSALVFLYDGPGLDTEQAAENIDRLLGQEGTFIEFGMLSEKNYAALVQKFRMPIFKKSPNSVDMYYFTRKIEMSGINRDIYRAEPGTIPELHSGPSLAQI